MVRRGAMAPQGRTYIVRDAGTAARPGKIYKTYPYTLRALLDAIDEARFRSFTGTPQVVVRANGRQRAVIRKFENGKEVHTWQQGE
jgi:hypothetical protein